MRRHLYRMAVAAASVAVMVVVPVDASLAASSDAGAYVCGRGLENPPCEAEPSALEFSDNHDLTAVGLAWSSWGGRSASAVGDITVNWTGTPATYRGVVRLSGLRACDGQRAYRAARVSWPGESVVIRLDCRSIPGGARSLEFHSSGGGLGCGMIWDPKDGSWARCDVANAAYQTPLTADCRDLDQGDSLVLGETVASTCHGDTVLRAGSVLAVGHGRRLGDIRCTMTHAGVTCRNLVTGHGFRMSRTRYRIW